MTILSESIIKCANTCGAIMLIVAVPCVALFIHSLIDGERMISIILGLVIVAILICYPIFGTQDVRKIKATISDDYPAIDLYDNYIIDDRDGDIWTLIENEE